MAFCEGLAHNSPIRNGTIKVSAYSREMEWGWVLPSRAAGGEGGRAMGAPLLRSRHGGRQSRTWLPLCVAAAGLAVAIGVGGRADAGKVRGQRQVASIETRDAGEPIMAIVSLRRQQITVYGANGRMLQAPVSSGQKGRETPAGIFSIIQKDAEHYSNLYDDAYMPHMQRITWSGIALHGGVLPGHPASHGCVRIPYDLPDTCST